MKSKEDIKLEKIKSNGVQLQVGIWKGGDKSIVCLHGLSANLYSWERIASNLQKLGYTVITYDLRGRGGSSKPEKGYGFDNHISDLENLIRHFRLEKPLLLSHSFGCMISIRAAIRFPYMVGPMILLDGGGLLSIAKRIQLLKVLKSSFDRLGKIFPTVDMYLDQFRNSPLIPNWSPIVENYLRKELFPVKGGFICHMPSFVMEKELNLMGGSMDTSQIWKRFLSSPWKSLSLLHKNRILEFEKVQSEVLILRSTQKNLFTNDDLLPKKSFLEMLQRISNSTGQEIATNHYGIVFDDLPERDIAIQNFLEKTYPTTQKSIAKSPKKKK
jgi:pimeloyl-ACP methyl ester carboxylesterase